MALQDNKAYDFAMFEPKPREGAQPARRVQKNNVISLPEKELEKVRQPFYMVDKSRSRKAGGAGLGLALCFQIAQSHGAALSFTSAPGAGTTATVIFTA